MYLDNMCKVGRQYELKVSNFIKFLQIKFC
jgi:hypothetical protein